VHELIELRKLRKLRQGIDAARLSVGDARRKHKRPVGEDGQPLEGEEQVKAGLQSGAWVEVEDNVDADLANADAKARRAVRSNNFTQQTNTLDVDKHMLAYIEENMRLRRGQQTGAEEAGGPGSSSTSTDPPDRFKADRKVVEEGSVTNSTAMLTAIPEVDLGMDARLKNIEDTEKAKLLMTQAKDNERRLRGNDEEHLASTRFYRPNLRVKSDADIIRDAKREAMGLPPQGDEEYRPRHERPQMATDELVMERFKKRMRK